MPSPHYTFWIPASVPRQGGILSGPRVLNAVPRSNTNGLVVTAVFSVKPQFYEDGSTTATATFTIAAP